MQTTKDVVGLYSPAVLHSSLSVWERGVLSWSRVGTAAPLLRFISKLSRLFVRLKWTVLRRAGDIVFKRAMTATRACREYCACGTYGASYSFSHCSPLIRQIVIKRQSRCCLHVCLCLCVYSSPSGPKLPYNNKCFSLLIGQLRQQGRRVHGLKCDIHHLKQSGPTKPKCLCVCLCIPQAPCVSTV